jgi:hypothetical protein
MAGGRGPSSVWAGSWALAAIAETSAAQTMERISQPLRIKRNPPRKVGFNRKDRAQRDKFLAKKNQCDIAQKMAQKFCCGKDGTMGIYL